MSYTKMIIIYTLLWFFFWFFFVGFSPSLTDNSGVLTVLFPPTYKTNTFRCFSVVIVTQGESSYACSEGFTLKVAVTNRSVFKFRFNVSLGRQGIILPKRITEPFTITSSRNRQPSHRNKQQQQRFAHFAICISCLKLWRFVQINVVFFVERKASIFVYGLGEIYGLLCLVA